MSKKEAEKKIKIFNINNAHGYDTAFYYPKFIDNYIYILTSGWYDNSGKIYGFTIDGTVINYEERYKVLEQIQELTNLIEEKYGKEEIRISDSILSELIDIEDTSFDINLKDWKIGKKDID